MTNEVAAMHLDHYLQHIDARTSFYRAMVRAIQVLEEEPYKDELCSKILIAQTKEERERLKEKFCDEYCKWPNEYSEYQETKFINADELGGSLSIYERVPLEESDICQNCPLRRL